MLHIIFVCLGNICRSPMAEFIMKDIVRRRGGTLSIASSATSREEEGCRVYPPAAAMLASHGIDCAAKRWIIPKIPATSPIRGTPAISRPPTMILWKAARRFMPI